MKENASGRREFHKRNESFSKKKEEREREIGIFGQPAIKKSKVGVSFLFPQPHFPVPQ